MVDLRDDNQKHHNGFPQVIFVHMGTPTQAESFFATYWPDAIAIGDPRQRLHRAFSIRWGSLTQFFKPAVWKAYFQSKSFGVGRPQGNTMRDPGAVLIRNQQVIYSQEFAHFGVMVDIEHIRSLASDQAV